MKIYNKIVLDIQTGLIIEEQSFDYIGPVAMADPASLAAMVGSSLGSVAATKIAPAALTSLIGAKGVGLLGNALGATLGTVGVNALTPSNRRTPIGMGLAAGALGSGDIGKMMGFEGSLLSELLGNKKKSNLDVARPDLDVVRPGLMPGLTRNMGKRPMSLMDDMEKLDFLKRQAAM